MRSPIVFVLFTLIFIFTDVQGIKNLLGTPIQECLNCLCHARTGCWSRENCASYSISKQYWKAAGSFVAGAYQNSDQAYQRCMKDENCILNTIKSYTESFGNIDCNCDGVFDCKDRFAIHLYGNACISPKFETDYVSRFNTCAQNLGLKFKAMLASEERCSK